RHTRSKRDWSSDVCSSDLAIFTEQQTAGAVAAPGENAHDTRGKRLLQSILPVQQHPGVHRLIATVRGRMHIGRGFNTIFTRDLRSEERRVGKEWRAGARTD